MKKSFTTMLVIAVLVFTSLPSVMHATAEVIPPLPMTIEGYVFIKK